MLGGLVNALWRPIANLAHHATTAPAAAQQQQQHAEAATPMKPAGQINGDPFVTPAPRGVANAMPPAFIPTPELTPVPKLMFKRRTAAAGGGAQANGRFGGRTAAGATAAPARKNRFSVGVVEDEDDMDDDEAANGRPAEEDKENSDSAAHRKRGANSDATSRAGAGTTFNRADPLEAETGHAVKKPKHGTPTTASPRRTRRSNLHPGGVATASIFNFGPLNTQARQAPLFTAKHAAKPKTATASAATAAAAKTTRPSSSSSDDLSSTLGGFQISAPGTYPVRPRPGAVSPAVPMEDVPMDVDMQAESPRTRSNAASPTIALGPLGSLSISPPIPAMPANAFSSMSLGDPTNPFQRPNAAQQSDIAAAAAERVRDFKASRESRSKDSMDRIRRERLAAKQQEAAAEKGSTGLQPDIKTRTRAETNPHAPLRTNTLPRQQPQTTKPPVPLFWSTTATPASAPASFTPLMPDAAFTSAVAGATSSAAPLSAPPVVLSSAPTFPVRSARDRDRVGITQSSSYRAVLDREETRRREREAARAKNARDARDKMLAERREQQEQQRQAQLTQQAADAEAARLHQLQLQEQQRQAAEHAQRAESAAVAAAAYAARQVRRSARHSVSPRSSPSPSPPPMQTPSPRNRFMTPPLSAATPAHAAAAAASFVAATPPERRTRSSMRAASPMVAPVPVGPSPRASRAAAAAAAAEHLAATIATRKANEAVAAAARLRDRQATLVASSQAADRAAAERDEWKGMAARKIAARARGKGYEQLLREFAPAIRAELTSAQACQYDALRKAMRKAMARFHPDKHSNSPARNQLEHEETFVVLKKAYDELTTLCR